MAYDSCLLDICSPPKHEHGQLPTTKLEHEFLFCLCACQCVCVCLAGKQTFAIHPSISIHDKQGELDIHEYTCVCARARARVCVCLC